MKNDKLNGFVKKYFSRGNIKSTGNLFLFKEQKKIIVFIPVEYADLLASEMSKAGAGVIGDYKSCSFRTKGIGTFLPSGKAKPFSGKKNKLAFEEEIKLEMECSAGNLNNVLDIMLEIHPYEETAYEIHNFSVREKKSSGLIIDLRKEEKLQVLLKKISGAKADLIENNYTYKRVALTCKSENASLYYSAKFLECDILIILNGNFKIIKIN